MFIKTTITIEVLSEESNAVNQMPLINVIQDCIEGCSSMREKSRTQEKITKDQLKQECKLHNTDVVFFIAEEDK